MVSLRRRLDAVGPAALLCALLFYILGLPALGMTWHRVVPEHEHWFLAHTLPDGDAEGTALGVRCAACASFPIPATTIHAFNPATALQALGMAISLGCAILLLLPPEAGRPLPPAPLLLTNFASPPLDPPPTLA
jgi:hypothetical protein